MLKRSTESPETSKSSDFFGANLPSTNTILIGLAPMNIPTSFSFESGAFSTILLVKLLGLVYFQYSSRAVGSPDFIVRSKASLRASALQPAVTNADSFTSRFSALFCSGKLIKMPRPVSLNNHCFQLL